MPLWLWIALGAGGLYLWSKSSNAAPQVGMGTSAGIPGAGSVPGSGMVNLTGNIFRVGQLVTLTQPFTTLSGSGMTIPVGTNGNVISTNNDGTVQVGFDQTTMQTLSPGSTSTGMVSTIPASSLQAVGS